MGLGALVNSMSFACSSTALASCSPPYILLTWLSQDAGTRIPRVDLNSGHPSSTPSARHKNTAKRKYRARNADRREGTCNHNAYNAGGVSHPHTAQFA